MMGIFGNLLKLGVEIVVAPLSIIDDVVSDAPPKDGISHTTSSIKKVIERTGDVLNPKKLL